VISTVTESMCWLTVLPVQLWPDPMTMTAQALYLYGRTGGH